ncbi:hypothetical protein HS088_TW11G00545 [Tripterygium wilfordii]|uniref:Uncharacterized protein n=1 Tax=Tripterygium wilfordii TaxID=458696 RepID=A0A7J7D331_TRIWF|nr:hypothetical protein HS088_TW11G00545 [Tripterygium wilfordii]
MFVQLILITFTAFVRAYQYLIMRPMYSKLFQLPCYKFGCCYSLLLQSVVPLAVKLFIYRYILCVTINLKVSFSFAVWVGWLRQRNPIIKVHIARIWVLIMQI